VLGSRKSIGSRKPRSTGSLSSAVTLAIVTVVNRRRKINGVGNQQRVRQHGSLKQTADCNEIVCENVSKIRSILATWGRRARNSREIQLARRTRNRESGRRRLEECEKACQKELEGGIQRETTERQHAGIYFTDDIVAIVEHEV
jgi:hypothetical protein